MIWLLGAQGMLGTEVRRRLEAAEAPHHATDAEVDIASRDDVGAVADEVRPTWILNCAAYTAVDRAESEEERAHAVNATGAGNVAALAEAVGARLVHVSTDYVFDGRREGPYPVDAPVAPLGAYGRSKEAGERAVRDATARHFVVRTSWLHGPHGANFVATMLRLMAERPALRVVDDQRGSPTYAGDLADALLAFIDKDADAFGTYHFANAGVTTWYGFAREIRDRAVACGILARAIPLTPIRTVDYPTPAPRPANSALRTDRIRAALGLRIPPWQDGLARHLAALEAP